MMDEEVLKTHETTPRPCTGYTPPYSGFGIGSLPGEGRRRFKRKETHDPGEGARVMRRGRCHSGGVSGPGGPDVDGRDSGFAGWVRTPRLPRPNLRPHLGDFRRGKARRSHPPDYVTRRMGGGSPLCRRWPRDHIVRLAEKRDFMPFPRRSPFRGRGREDRFRRKVPIRGRMFFGTAGGRNGAGALTIRCHRAGADA